MRPARRGGRLAESALASEPNAECGDQQAQDRSEEFKIGCIHAKQSTRDELRFLHRSVQVLRRRAQARLAAALLSPLLPSPAFQSPLQAPGCRSMFNSEPWATPPPKALAGTEVRSHRQRRHLGQRAGAPQRLRPQCPRAQEMAAWRTRPRGRHRTPGTRTPPVRIAAGADHPRAKRTG
jgi:hypothetical protein